MRLTHRVIECRTARTFRISQSANDAFPMVIAELEHEGVVGYGEASPSRRVTGETVESVGHFLDWAAKEVSDVRPEGWEAFLDHVHGDAAAAEGSGDQAGGAFASGGICGNPSARAALDIAVHDLVGKLRGVPVRALYGLPAARLETCMTVSLDAPDAMAEEAREYRARGFRVLKLKLGQAAGDLARLDAVRRAVPDARLRADANTGWTLDETLALLPGLARRGVEFVEQPVPPARMQDLVAASRGAPLPVYADESVMDVHDVRALHDAGFAGGMNLKLQKTGGIRPAVAALREARRLGHQVQLGCNVETAVGIAAGVQLLALLDHADLDGHLLLADEPFLGPRPMDGWYETPDEPGLGVRKGTGSQQKG